MIPLTPSQKLYVLTVSGNVEHHHGIHHSTSLCLEDAGTYANQVGIIPYDVWLMASEMEINQSLSSQPDVGSSDGELMTTSSSDSTSLEGGTSISRKTEAGMDDFESAENLRGPSDSKNNGLEGHATQGNKEQAESEPEMNHTAAGATTNHTDHVSASVLGTPVIAQKRPDTLEDIIPTSPLNIPVIVTPFKKQKKQKKYKQSTYVEEYCTQCSNNKLNNS